MLFLGGTQGFFSRHLGHREVISAVGSVVRATVPSDWDHLVLKCVSVCVCLTQRVNWCRLGASR